jgi:hypothetical protein
LTKISAVDLNVQGSMALGLKMTFPTTLHTDVGSIAFINGAAIDGGSAVFNS